jgi:hypothetical protein
MVTPMTAGMNKMVLVLDDMIRPFVSSPLFGPKDIEDQYSGDADFRLFVYRRRIRNFKEKLDGLGEIGPCIFEDISLAGDVELRAQRNESVILSFDDCSQLTRCCHGHPP